MLPPNRKRKVKVVVEPSSYKPQLSWLRDRDKLLLPRHRVPVLEEQGTKAAERCRKNELPHRSNEEPGSNCHCSISSLTVKQEEKTNGCSSSANNCPMAPLKYFCPSLPFFSVRLFPSTSCPCSCQRSRQCYFWRCNNQQNECNDENNTDHKPFNDIKGIRNKASERCFCSTYKSRNDKRFSSAIIILLVIHFLLFFAKLIPVASATPLPSSSIPTPTRTTTLTLKYSEDASSEEAMRYIERLSKKRLEENPVVEQDEPTDYRHHIHHHQLYRVNNGTFDDSSGAEVENDEVGGMKNEMSGVDVNITRGHSRARNLYSDGIKNDISRNRSGGNQLEFSLPPASTSGPQELPKNSNNKSKLGFGNRKENGVQTSMPLAVRFRTGPSSSPAFPPTLSSHELRQKQKQQQQQDASAPVTNDLSPEIEESSSKNNDENESSFLLINNNNKQNDDNSNFIGGSGGGGVPTTITTFSTASTLHAGKCWPVPAEETEENETESLPSSLLSTVSNSFLISAPTTTTTPGSQVRLVCNGTNHLAITLSQIPENLVHQAISIVVKDSQISTLNLSLFHRFSRLESLSVTHANITQIVGTCPVGLKALNVSHNSIRKLNSSIFSMSGSQEMELYEYEEGEDADDDDSSLEGSNSGGENMAGNFSTEVISSYFAETAKQLQLLRENKSVSELELLSLSPSSSSSLSSSPEPSDEKIPINSRFKTDHYSKKLMGTPVVRRAGTRKVGPSPFLTNEEKRNELGDKDSSVFGISVADQFQQPDELIKAMSKAKHIMAAAGMEAALLETAETNESSADTDEDDDDDDDGEDESVSHKYTDAGTNKSGSDQKMVKRATPTKASGSGDISIEERANTGCAINDRLCKAGKSGRRKRRQAIRKDLNVYDHHQHDHRQQQQHKSDDDATTGDLGGRQGYSYEHEKSVREGRGYYYGHYLHPTVTSSASSGGTTDSSSSSGGSSSAAVSKWESETEAYSKPTLFPMEKATRRMIRKRKARITTTSSSSSSSRTTTGLSLEDIDLSYNKISELPKTLFQLKSLKSLRIAGNRLKRDFVWEKLADWYMNTTDPSILVDGDDAFCVVVDGASFFQFTVLGVLKAKKDFVETCQKVDKNICHGCSIYVINKEPGHGYNASHSSPNGDIAIALKLDCSYRNLSELPTVPPQTWHLNVSGNSIKDLTPLKEPMFENLLVLDADHNEINTLDGLFSATTFLDKYTYLSLQNNRFSVIPPTIFTVLKNMRGQGVTHLGDNYIDCDCDTVKDTKPLLLENSKKLRDLKNIFCKDMKSRSGDTPMAVKDLQFTDLCYLDTEESNEMYLYLVILVELLLIFVIVAKVWHDQRTFRRTGILPWCSAKMPRLPCDAMLESVKEPPNFNRSSSTNVRSYTCEPPATQSISSCVQLREVRSNSGQSEKSSQISQLSSFPGSSRTSSV